jgi:hypothetical protein
MPGVRAPERSGLMRGSFRPLLRGGLTSACTRRPNNVSVIICRRWARVMLALGGLLVAELEGDSK